MPSPGKLSLPIKLMCREIRDILTLSEERQYIVIFRDMKYDPNTQHVEVN
jgi:hypothetical protein